MIRRSFAAIPAIALACVSVDCAWVTDLGANGYTLEDSGMQEGGAKGDGGPQASGCSSAADCNAGALCCVTSLSPVATSCQSSCTALPDVGGVQICSTDDECSAGMCALQNCFGNTVSACGTISACSGALEDEDAAAAPDTSVSTVIPPVDASSTISD